MKRLLLLLALTVCVTMGFAQEHVPQRRLPHPDSLPYKLYPGLPAFNIRLMDSFTVFNTFTIPKGRFSLLILFDPTCKHCRIMTDELVRGMDSLQNIDMYWLTSMPSMTAVREFYKEYDLKKYKNIKVMGRDYEYFFVDHFAARNLPTLALYDEHKKFMYLFTSHVSVKELYEYTHKQ